MPVSPDPYHPPQGTIVPAIREGNVMTEAPCGKCGCEEAIWKEVTWWGAMLGPKLLHHVQCVRCGAYFNARTGRSNRLRIALFVLISGGILLMLGLIAAAAWQASHTGYP